MAHKYTKATPANQPRSRSKLTRAQRKIQKFYNNFIANQNLESKLSKILNSYVKPDDLSKM